MSDSLYPNPVELSSGGEIIVPGVELPEANITTVVGESAIAWEDTLGTIREWIMGTLLAAVHELLVVSQADSADYALALLGSQVGGAAGDSYIELDCHDSSGGAAQLVALNSLGRSQFALNETVTKRVYYPSGTNLTWPGGTNADSVVFTHGQPTPVNALYFAQYIDTAGGNGCFAEIRSPTTGGCVITVLDPFGSPAAGTAFGLYILSILEY